MREIILEYLSGLNVITRVLKGKEGGKRVREDVRIEAEVRVMQPQAKECGQLVEEEKGKGMDSPLELP